MADSNQAVIAGSLLVAGAAALLAYQRLVRPWCLHWGASSGEVAQALPGDDLVAEPAGTTTRAVTIEAPPTAVWPWLVQLGQGRGGAYTYDWIENLFGLGMHSADRILPEFQHIAIGDVLLRTPASEMQVQALDPERLMVAAAPDGQWSWAFVLSPLDSGGTRFISRNRWPGGGGPGQRLGMLVLELGSLIMEHKMLLGIKQRAERGAAPVAPAPNSDKATAVLGTANAQPPFAPANT